MKQIEIRCAKCGKMIPYSGEICPYCGTDKREAKKKYNIVALIVLIVFVIIIANLFNNDDVENTSNTNQIENTQEKSSSPIIENNVNNEQNQVNTTKTLETEFPDSWLSATEGEFVDITRTLMKNNIKGCGIYYYKRGKSEGYYLVACSIDCDNWDYYLVYTGNEKVLGPYSNGGDKSFIPNCD